MPRKSKRNQEHPIDSDQPDVALFLKQAKQAAQAQANSAVDASVAALHETTAEVLQGLIRAHDHYARKSESARQGDQANAPGVIEASDDQVQLATAVEQRITNRTATSDRRHIKREELRNRMDSGQPTVIYDARSHEAWSASETKLPGALRISSAHELANAGAVPDSSLIVVYNADGELDVEPLLRDLENKPFEALVLEGGFDSWQAADYPLENKTVQEKKLELETEG